MKKIILIFAMLAFVSFTINAQTKATDTQKKAPVSQKKSAAHKKTAAGPKKAVLEVSKLPKEIQDNIKTHAGFTAVKAWSVTDKGVVTYEVTDNKITYFYDKDKKFVKEEAVKVKKEEVKKTTTTTTVKKDETKKVDTKPVK